MMLGVYLGQYCINGITYFFLTWFPVYLVQERGMTILKAGFIASLPAICGFIGGVLGGVISDYLLRKGHSLTFARKAPIIAGLLVSSSIVACNYVDIEWMVVGFMAWPSSAKAWARWAGRWCPTPRRNRSPASVVACSTPSATSPRSPRRS
jgi:ACS family glucarate transporter-like MFS transporter